MAIPYLSLRRSGCERRPSREGGFGWPCAPPTARRAHAAPVYQGERKSPAPAGPARWHFSYLPHPVPAKAVDPALAGERAQRHLARLPGLEPHRRASRNVEPHAARLPAVERQRRIGLEEMIVRA